MRCVIKCAEGVCHRVNDAETYIREAHSCNVLTESHIRSAFGSIVNCAAERTGNNFNGFEMEHIGELPCALCYISFNSVCKSVHTCCGCESLGHAGHHIGVNNCYYGNIVNVYANHLAVFLNVSDNVVYRNLCSGACRCRNCDYRNGFVLCGSDALKRTNVRKVGVVYDYTDSLCRIHGRTAADSDEVVRACFFESVNACLDVFYCGVRLDFGEHGISKTCFVKKVGYLL